MIKLELDGLYIKISTLNFKFLDTIRDELSDYKEGYEHSDKFQSGIWNGKISMLRYRKIPYGVFSDFLAIKKKFFPNEEMDISEIKQFFSGEKFSVDYDCLNISPAPHQRKCIDAAIKHSKGIIRLATAGGKSLVMAVIIKNLFKQKLIRKQLIIVPNISLVSQLRENFVDEYGIPEEYVGCVSADKKEWGKPIVISTWQMFIEAKEDAKKKDKNGKKIKPRENHKWRLKEFDSIFVDEVQIASAFEMRGVLEHAIACRYRLGFTGTLPDHRLNVWDVKALLGPVLINISAKYLMDIGWISQCLVHKINIEYKREYTGIYNVVKNEIFKNKFRLGVIESIVHNVKKGTVLLLVEKIESEGNYLKSYLEGWFPSRKVIFLSGKDSIKKRDEIRNECKDENNKIILIATYPLFQAGIDIPPLAHVVFAAPFKSKIRILQSIGRALRKHTSKKDGAHIWDIIDWNNKWLENYSHLRQRYYNMEEFDVTEEFRKE